MTFPDFGFSRNRRESNKVVANSHNLFYFQQNINYASSSSNSKDKLPTAADTSILRRVFVGKTQDEQLRRVLGTELENITEGTATTIEEELGGRTNPTAPSSATDDQVLQEHTRNTSRTIRLVDSPSAKEAQYIPQNFTRNDNVSGRSVKSGGTSQGSKQKKAQKFPRLLIEDLQFPEPVEKHVETYMISRKRRFRDSRHVICLWDPFLSLDVSSDMQEKHCTLGDVGTFNSIGGFDVLFNIFLNMEENHQMNYCPPTTFTPYESATKKVSRDPGQDSDCFMTYDLVRGHGGGSDVQGRDATYTFRSIKFTENTPYNGSAILVTPTGCVATRIDRAVFDQIEVYLAANMESWYDRDNYPDEYHKYLSKGSLHFISACYKSNVWAAAAVPHHQPSVNEGELAATLSRRPAPNLKDYDWDFHPSFEVTHGSSKPGVPRNIDYTVAVEVCPLNRRTRTIFDRIGTVTTALNNVADSVFSFRTKHKNSSTSHFTSFR